MGKRLTQIATRTGDDGTTGLGDNTRVSKDSLRVHAMGDVDELNSHIGLLLCEQLPDERARRCWWRSSTSCSTWAASCRSRASSCSRPRRWRRWTRRWRTTTRSCPSWRSSSCRPATAPRRRRMCAARWRAGPSARWWRWARPKPLRETPRQYLNRLSDLMFVLARVLNRMDGGDDVYWKSERLRARSERPRDVEPTRGCQHRHRDARHAGQLARVVAQVDVPHLRAAADVHRPRRCRSPSPRSRRAGGWR